MCVRFFQGRRGCVNKEWRLRKTTLIRSQWERNSQYQNRLHILPLSGFLLYLLDGRIALDFEEPDCDNSERISSF